MNSVEVPRSFLTAPVVFLLLLLAGAGCEDFRSVTVKNETGLVLREDVRAVPLDYASEYQPAYADIREVFTMEPGEESAGVSDVSRDPEYGRTLKILVTAVKEDDEIVYQRLLTWDELNDQGWYITITTDELEEFRSRQGRPLGLE